MEYVTVVGVLMFLLALGWLADRFHYDPRPSYPPEEDPLSLYLNWKIAQMRIEENPKQAEIQDALEDIDPKACPQNSRHCGDSSAA